LASSKIDDLVKDDNYTPLIKKYLDSLDGSQQDILVNGKVKWWPLYSLIFEKEFRTPQQQHEVIGRYVNAASEKSNHAHVCLAEIIRLGYCSNVLTTNFDELIFEELTSHRIIPTLCDSYDTFSRFSKKPRTIQLIHLHGSKHSYKIINTIQDIVKHGHLDSFHNVINNATESHDNLIFIGYGANEEWFSKFIELRKRHLDKNIYWICYESNFNELSTLAQQFLMLNEEKTHVLYEQDADAFFHELTRKLDISLLHYDLIHQITPITPAARSDQSNIAFHQARADREREYIIAALKNYREGRSIRDKVITKVYKYISKQEYDKALRCIKKIRDPLELFQLAYQSEIKLKKFRNEKQIRLIIEIYSRIESLSHTNLTTVLLDSLGQKANLLKDISVSAKSVQDAAKAIETLKKLEHLIPEQDLERISKLNNSYGVALFRYAELNKEDSKALLQHSIARFDKALEHRCKRQKPQFWSNTTINKANSIKTLALRSPNQADCASTLRALNQAILMLKETVAVQKKLKHRKDRFIIAKSHDNIGHAYFNKADLYLAGDYYLKAFQSAKKAIHHSEVAMDLFIEFNEPFFRDLASSNLAKSYILMSYCNKDIQKLDWALDIAEQTRRDISPDHTELKNIFDEIIRKGNIFRQEILSAVN